MACSVAGCERGGRLVRGWCKYHWSRWRKHGDPEAPAYPNGHAPIPPEVRFWAKVDKTESCWIWTGHIDPSGYGAFNFGKRGDRRLAHRVAYEFLREPIPTDLTIDHLCRNRACVNPAHLEVVTRAENGRRANAGNRGVGSCVNGHEYTPENLLPATYKRRACRACNDAANARRNARRRAITASGSD